MVNEFTYRPCRQERFQHQPVGSSHQGSASLLFTLFILLTRLQAFFRATTNSHRCATFCSPSSSLRSKRVRISSASALRFVLINSCLSVLQVWPSSLLAR